MMHVAFRKLVTRHRLRSRIARRENNRRVTISRLESREAKGNNGVQSASFFTNFHSGPAFVADDPTQDLLSVIILFRNGYTSNVRDCVKLNFNGNMRTCT